MSVFQSGEWGNCDEGLNDVWGNNDLNWKDQDPDSRTPIKQLLSDSDSRISSVTAGPDNRTFNAETNITSSPRDVEITYETDNCMNKLEEKVAVSGEIPLEESVAVKLLKQVPTGNESNDDFEDDFGEFEEIHEHSLEFNQSVEKLLDKLFNPTQIISDHEITDKFSFLVSDGTKAMKYYNVLTSENRQYLAGSFDLVNTRQRGCFEKMETMKEISAVVENWIFNEKGINKETNLEKEATIRSSNFFKWSTDTDHEKTKSPEPEKVGAERKQIGQKLLNASYQQVRNIIEQRLEGERRERAIVERAKFEREQKLLKEKEKRSEELAKYHNNVANIEKRKKGLFGKIFKGKSKIAKDHISHEKVVTDDIARGDDHIHELSLREEMERQGYLKSENIPKHKFKFKGKRRRKANNDDDDDEEEDDDDDQDSDQDERNRGDYGYSVLGFDSSSLQQAGGEVENSGDRLSVESKSHMEEYESEEHGNTNGDQGHTPDDSGEFEVCSTDLKLTTPAVPSGSMPSLHKEGGEEALGPSQKWGSTKTPCPLKRGDSTVNLIDL
ncbi:unnamed protein product [Pichia kudriavzevii]